MKDLQNLLDQVSTIVKKNNEILEATGGRFNVFKILGVDHYETINSTVLAEFLNPKGSHGLKDAFLKAFLEAIVKRNAEFKMFADLFVSENADVGTEKDTYEGRLDILIEDNNGHAIIIENKIYATDQWEQIKRYNKFALGKYFKKENYQILYLTPNGTKASKDSGEGIEYISISYSSFIIEWLEHCVNLASRFPLVRETINQYINHLKKLTNQDMDNQNLNEILDLMSKQEYLSSTFAISNNIAALKNKIINDSLVPQLIEIEKELNIEYVRKPGNNNYDFVNTSWCSPFHFRIPSKKYSIYSEFGATNLQKLEYGFGCDDKETLDALKKIIGCKSSHKWFAFKGFKPYSSWGEKAFVAILNGQMKKAIKSEIEWMLEQTKSIGL